MFYVGLSLFLKEYNNSSPESSPLEVPKTPCYDIKSYSNYFFDPLFCYENFNDNELESNFSSMEKSIQNKPKEKPKIKKKYFKKILNFRKISKKYPVKISNQKNKRINSTSRGNIFRLKCKNKAKKYLILKYRQKNDSIKKKHKILI